MYIFITKSCFLNVSSYLLWLHIKCNLWFLNDQYNMVKFRMIFHRACDNNAPLTAKNVLLFFLVDRPFRNFGWSYSQWSELKGVNQLTLESICDKYHVDRSTTLYFVWLHLIITDFIKHVLKAISYKFELEKNLTWPIK